eukprot:TRINITY_DN4508_c0_g1_i2.p1 TRINITY_DN4508_c0_g1~~TRINITY_DN4508_c0_g1_i2.p1  ORF type:complete len:547 (-),score=121.81 TRINITY_DN4508_c0_g1_i2:24-1664(-)
MKFFIFLILFLALSNALQKDVPFNFQDYPNSIKIEMGATFYWKIVDDKKMIDVGIIMDKDEWVALGFGNMQVKDLLYLSSKDGNFICEDRWIQDDQIYLDNEKDPKDSLIDCDGGYYGNKVFFTFKRNLDTKDSKNDVPIRLEKTFMYFTMGTEVNLLKKLMGDSELETREIHFGQLSPDVVPQSYSFGHKFLEDDYEFYWNLIERDTILDVGVVVNGKGWLVFGIGQNGLEKADVIMGRYIGEDFIVEDKWSNETSTTFNPTINDTLLGGQNNILEYGGNRINGITQMRFRRNLKTGDKFDHDITGATIRCFFAFNAETDDLVFKGSTAIQMYVNFVRGAAFYNPRLYPEIHAILMVTGWHFFIIAGIFVACFVPKKNSLWFYTHIILQSIGALCILTALVIILVNIRLKNNNPYFLFSKPVVGAHQVIGYFVVIGCFLQIIIGITADRLWRYKFNKTNQYPQTSFVDRLHWWLGRLTFLLSIVNVFLGIYFFGLAKIFFYLFGAWIVLLASVAIVLQYFKTKAAKNSNDLILHEQERPLINDDY